MQQLVDVPFRLAHLSGLVCPAIAELSSGSPDLARWLGGREEFLKLVASIAIKTWGCYFLGQP
jgi:hypothetical protein